MIWPGRHQIGMVAAMRLEWVAAFVGIRIQARVSASLAAIAAPDGGLVVILIVVAGDQTASIAVSIAPDPLG